MKKFASALGLTLLATFSSLSSASSVQASVETVMLDRKFNGHIFIKLDNRPEGTCSSSAWDYVLKTSDDIGQLLYTNILTLYASGKTAKFVGSDSCGSLHSSFEELLRLEMN